MNLRRNGSIYVGYKRSLARARGHTTIAAIRSSDLTIYVRIAEETAAASSTVATISYRSRSFDTVHWAQCSD